MKLSQSSGKTSERGIEEEFCCLCSSSLRQVLYMYSLYPKNNEYSTVTYSLNQIVLRAFQPLAIEVFVKEVCASNTKYFC